MVLGIRGIEESSVYQAILKKGEARGEARAREGRGASPGGREAKGRAKEARETLIRLGSRKFGPPRKRARARIEGLEDLRRLQALTDRIFDVATWDELLSSTD